MADYPPLHIARTFNSPRQAVWDAWTKPKLFKQWYMPHPFSVPSCEFDVRPGGAIHIDTQAPDGSIMPLIGTYIVVEEPSKLVFTNSPLDAAGQKLFEIQHTVELTESDGVTTLHITSEVLMAGPHAEQFLSGMKPGLEQALDQMKEIVEANY